MKKLLYTLLLLPLGLFAQTIMSIEQDRPLNLVSGWNIIGFTCNEPIDVVDAFLPIVDKVIIAKDNNGGAYLPEFGFNGIGFFEYGYGYQLKLTETITDFQFCPFLVPLVEGCMDSTAFNYNSSANLDDGSCYPFVYGCLDNLYIEYNDFANTDDGSCETLIVWGCIDESALNFNEEANADDGSCIYPIGGIEFQLNYGWNLVGFTGCEITPIEEALQDALANGSLEETFDIIKDVRGRMWHPALGDNSPLTHLTPGEGYFMKVKPGQATTVSFSEAYCNDITYQLNSGWNMVGYTGDEVSNVVSAIEDALVNGNSIQETFDLIKDVRGYFWNEFFDGLGTLTPGEGYFMKVKEGQETTLSFTDNSTQVFSNNLGVEFTIPATDNNMSVIFPIGSLSGFAGNEIYVGTEDYSDYITVSENHIINEDGSVGIAVIGNASAYSESNLANWGDNLHFRITSSDGALINIDLNPAIAYNPNGVHIVSEQLGFSIDGEQVVFGCINSSYVEYDSSANLNDGSCSTEAVFGCMDSLACNYNPDANMADGSCEYANLGYDCNGNIAEYVVGMEAEGGIVFYVNSTGERGLVVSPETLTEYLDNYYDWGCYGEDVDGADQLGIGFGYQNTIDIIEQNCSTSNGEPNIAQIAMDYSYGEYEDWFLPSIDELETIFHNVASILAINNDWIASSTEKNPNQVYCVDFQGPQANYHSNGKNSNNARFVRAFGNWTMGCIDSLACNYNPEANMADGSCEYANEGYDCEGNVCPEDPVFLNWLQHNYPSYLINSTCIDVESVSSYTGPIIIGPDSTMQNIDGIQYFNTTYLEINGLSQLVEIPNISGMTNLETLAIGNNDVLTTLPDLSDLTNLSTIGIGYNNSLESLPDLSELSNLTFLDINDNYSLTTLPDLSGLSNLDTLLIYNNSSLECALGYPEQIIIEEDWPPVCGEEVTYQVGDLAEGGIVFYVDSTGQHGLVAAMEDLEGTYEWGCYEQGVNGADGTSIGTGNQNTMDIVNQGCTTENGGITAAQAALDAEINGYSDWYLPSNDELVEMYYTIGNGGPEGNIGGFSSLWYWSSSEVSNVGAWLFSFVYGGASLNSKLDTYRVRVIRAF